MFYTNHYSELEEFSEQLLMSPEETFNSTAIGKNHQMNYSTQSCYSQYSSFYDYGMQQPYETFNQHQNYQNHEEFYSYQNYQNTTSCKSNGSSTSDFDSEMDTSYNNDYHQQTHNSSQIDASMEPNQNSKRKRKRVLNTIQRHEATMREKRRMIKLNTAFEDLRKVLPINDISKNKLSRAETLKSAIDYIQRMSQLLSLV